VYDGQSLNVLVANEAAVHFRAHQLEHAVQIVGGLPVCVLDLSQGLEIEGNG
jgi:hypothetical protein